MIRAILLLEDLTLILDNLVADFDVNQNIKYIYNEDLTLESGWQLKYLDLDDRQPNITYSIRHRQIYQDKISQF